MACTRVCRNMLDKKAGEDTDEIAGFHCNCIQEGQGTETRYYGQDNWSDTCNDCRKETSSSVCQERMRSGSTQRHKVCTVFGTSDKDNRNRRGTSTPKLPY